VRYYPLKIGNAIVHITIMLINKQFMWKHYVIYLINK